MDVNNQDIFYLLSHLRTCLTQGSFTQKLAPNKGLEPLTLRLKVWCSTDWANRAQVAQVVICDWHRIVWLWPIDFLPSAWLVSWWSWQIVTLQKVVVEGLAMSILLPLMNGSWTKLDDDCFSPLEQPMFEVTSAIMLACKNWTHMLLHMHPPSGNCDTKHLSEVGFEPTPTYVDQNAHSLYFRQA